MNTRVPEKSPRLAHVVISLANGGLERLVLRWTLDRNQRAPESTLVYCLDELGELAAELPVDMVRCLHARRAMFPWDRRVVQRLHNWLIEDGIHIVHSHNLPAQQYAALATSKTPIAHVYTQHGPGRHNLRFKNTLRSKILAHVTDRIIAVSYDTARCMNERYGVPRDRIEVIPNGIGPHQPAHPDQLAQWRQELGLAENDFVLGSLGRLASIKAWDRFLPVFGELGARSAEIGAAGPPAFGRGARSAGQGAGSAEQGAEPQSLRATELQSPRATERQSPRATEPQSPRATELQSPRATEPQSPRATELQSPRATELQSLRASELQSPRASELQSPRASELQSLRASELQSPRTSERQSLRASELQSPRTSERQKSEDSSLQSPVSDLRSTLNAPRPSPLAPRPSPLAPRPSPLALRPSPLAPRPSPLALRLLLVGDGPERAAIEQQVDKLGLREQVIFAGFQSRARQFLDLLDVFVLPSYAEGLSVALLEAMAAGLPVIATDVGDNRAVVEPVGAGLILPADTTTWCPSITEFLADPAQLRLAGQRGREHVLQRYTAESTWQAYEDIYTSLLVKVDACRQSLATIDADGDRHKSTSFGTGGNRGWRHPNLVTQLRYHGITARLMPKWVRAIAHRFLPPTERDTSLWMATYQNVLRHARPTGAKLAGVKLGIVKDVMLRHGYYEAACLELGVDYQCLDLTAANWQEQVKQLGAPVYLVRPFVLHSVGKALYDERLHILTAQLGQTIFPACEELWLYESKRRVAEWLVAHAIPHPATHVFCDRDAAMEFADQASFPLVFKADLGSESLGVQIVRSRRQCRSLVKTCFGRGYCQPRRDPRDRQWGFIIFQDFIPGAKEWRMVRIGNSFFGHQKGREGDFHSGTKLKIYEPPPRELLELTRRITDAGNFASMAVDILEDGDGNYLVTEMQAYFGSVNPFLMIVDNRKGRYLWQPDSGDYRFEEGDFCRNNCCNLRLALVLERLGLKPPMQWSVSRVTG